MPEREREYEWFFRTEFPPVLRTVFLILRDRGLAEDLAQDAFLQLYRGGSRLRSALQPAPQTCA